jgi:hypothetical protein
MGEDVLRHSGAAVTLGVLLTPVAAILALVNPRLAHDADCASLLGEANTPPGAPAQQSQPSGR